VWFLFTPNQSVCGLISQDEKLYSDADLLEFRCHPDVVAYPESGDELTQ
jgi:hypothetical protein